MRSVGASRRTAAPRVGFALCGALTLLVAVRPAAAFCVTNTCASEDSGDDTARCTEENGCQVGGKPLFWPGRCISFSVHEGGSSLRDISTDDARRVIGEAFYTWSHVECPDGGSPAIEVFDVSPVACGAVEFDLDKQNANIWTFQDVRWPYDDEGTLALTTVTYDPSTGEIFDADVEINTAENAITVGDGDVSYDLASIATHEAGHVLGLSHSPESSATMYAAYDAGSVSTRRLHIDDVYGICTAIAPDREVPEACDPFPSTGFSPECHSESGGCAGIATRGSRRGTALGLLLLGALTLHRRLRRRGTRGTS